MVEKSSKLTEADKIWEEVKDLPIDMFSLPNQKVHNYTQKINVLPDALCLKILVSAVIPFLEPAFNYPQRNMKELGRLEVEDSNNGMVIVRRVMPQKA